MPVPTPPAAPGPPVRLRDLLRPPAAPADPRVLTGHPARTPRRRTLTVPDPVSGTPSSVAVWEYAPVPEAAPGSPSGLKGDAAAAPLVFVHGFRGDHHGLALLADALPEHPIHSIELPGFGASEPFPHAEHTVAHHADAVAAVVTALGLPAAPVLVAHSYGTTVAAELVARDPSRWGRLVLLNPIAEPALEASASVSSRVLAAVAEGYYEVVARLPERPARLLLGAPPVVWVTTLAMTRTRDRDVLAYTHDQHRRHFSGFASARMLSEAYRASSTGCVADVAARLTLPVLLVAGREDPLGSVPAQEALAAAIDAAGGTAELHVLDGVGHLLHYERPTACAALIRDWLRRAGR